MSPLDRVDIERSLATNVPYRMVGRMYYSRKPDVRIQRVKGETLVLDDDNGYIHQLNETASFVWRHCDGKSSLADIVQRLTEAFDVEPDVATKDVLEVIEKFREMRLLCE